MKKRVVYIIISFLFVFATGFIFLNSKKHKEESQLPYEAVLSRTSASQNAEWDLVKTKADVLIKNLKKMEGLDWNYIHHWLTILRLNTF